MIESSSSKNFSFKTASVSQIKDFYMSWGVLLHTHIVRVVKSLLWQSETLRCHQVALWVMWASGFERKAVLLCCVHFDCLFLNCPRWVQHCFRTAMLDQWITFKNLVPTLPTMQRSHWVTLVKKIKMMCSFLFLGFLQLFLNMCRLYSSRPVDTL